MRILLTCSMLVVATIALLPVTLEEQMGKPVSTSLKVEQEIFTTNGIDAKIRILLQKELNITDLEERRRRLENLGRKFEEKQLTAEKKTLISEKLNKIKKVKIDKPPSETASKPSDISNYLFEGDINLSEEQLSYLEASMFDGSFEKKGMNAPVNKWTNNTLNYYIHASISDRKRNSIMAAIKYLEERTCIKFNENSTIANRVKVYSGSGCSASDIGMTGKEQAISIGDGCEVIGTVAHEFTHILGFCHTQSRDDRDKYVTIDTSVVEKNKTHNFVKRSLDNKPLHSVPYEYGSFMHYRANA